jgi:hypothetical protein
VNAPSLRELVAAACQVGALGGVARRLAGVVVGSRSPKRGTSFDEHLCPDRTPCDHALIPRFIVTIEGPGWRDVEDVELPRLPDEGESLETKFGTMVVAHAEEAPDLAAYAGKIVCRFA